MLVLHLQIYAKANTSVSFVISILTVERIV